MKRYAQWKTLTQEDAFTNNWWTYRRDTFEYAEGHVGEYHYVHSRGSALIIPRLPEKTFLVVKQYRYLWKRDCIEFPTGGVKEGDSHEDTAKLELAEETGFSASKLSLIGSFNPYKGVSDEECRVYLAEELTPTDATPDDVEDITTIELSAEEIDLLIKKGEIWDGMSIAAWYLYRQTC